MRPPKYMRPYIVKLTPNQLAEQYAIRAQQDVQNKLLKFIAIQSALLAGLLYNYEFISELVTLLIEIYGNI